jgi:hypothetical protein
MPATNGLIAWIERVTSAFAVITTDHALIHSGLAYKHSEIFTVSGTYAVSVRTPVLGYVHWKPTSISASGGPLTVELFEGTTSTGGTTKTAVNKNRLRRLTNISGTTIKTGVTKVGGASLDMLLIPSSTNGSQKFGASSEAEEEDVLMQDTEYTIVFTENVTGSIDVNLRTFWYEEDGA